MVFLLSLALVAVPWRSGAGETVTLDINAAYEVVLRPDVDCRGFRVAGSGWAVGSPIPQAMVEDHACADLATSPGRITFRSATMTLRSTPADRIDITYTADADAIPDMNGYLHPFGSFTVTGGAGVFEGVAGSGVFSSVTHPVVGATTAHLQGTLTLP
jgi:hypothetical protein